MIHPSDLLSEAQSLLRTATTARGEARLRTVVSRAYYAAYHHARDHPLAAAYQFGADAGIGMHRSFLTFLGKVTDRDVAFAAKTLNGMYDWRVRADYALNRTIAVEQTRRCLEDAEDCAKESSHRPPSPQAGHVPYEVL